MGHGMKSMQKKLEEVLLSGSLQSKYLALSARHLTSTWAYDKKIKETKSDAAECLFHAMQDIHAVVETKKISVAAAVGGAGVTPVTSFELAFYHLLNYLYQFISTPHVKSTMLFMAETERTYQAFAKAIHEAFDAKDVDFTSRSNFLTAKAPIPGENHPSFGECLVALKLVTLGEDLAALHFKQKSSDAAVTKQAATEDIAVRIHAFCEACFNNDGSLTTKGKLKAMAMQVETYLKDAEVISGLRSETKAKLLAVLDVLPVQYKTPTDTTPLSTAAMSAAGGAGGYGATAATR